MTEKTEISQKKVLPPAAGGIFEAHPFDMLRKQVDRLFEDFPSSKNLADFNPFGGFSKGWAASPPVDFVDKGTEYEISAELPGLDEKNATVTLSGGVLTIGGEKRDEKEEKREGYHLSERRYGSFKRSFTVPLEVDADKIAAHFDKGVLKITLPKGRPAPAEEKKIAITVK